MSRPKFVPEPELVGVIVVLIIIPAILLILLVVHSVLSNPIFEIGDCVEERRKASERWEEDVMYLRAQILDLGEEKYHIYNFDYEKSMSLPYSYDRHLKKVPCWPVPDKGEAQ